MEGGHRGQIRAAGSLRVGGSHRGRHFRNLWPRSPDPLCSWAAEIMFRVKYVPDQSKDPDSGQADP